MIIKTILLQLYIGLAKRNSCIIYPCLVSVLMHSLNRKIINWEIFAILLLRIAPSLRLHLIFIVHTHISMVFK